MVDCCKSFVVMMNTLTLIIGLGVVGIGLYLVIEYNDEFEDAYGGFDGSEVRKPPCLLAPLVMSLWSSTS